MGLFDRFKKSLLQPVLPPLEKDERAVLIHDLPIYPFMVTDEVFALAVTNHRILIYNEAHHIPISRNWILGVTRSREGNELSLKIKKGKKITLSGTFLPISQTLTPPKKITIEIPKEITIEGTKPQIEKIFHAITNPDACYIEVPKHPKPMTVSEVMKYYKKIVSGK